MSVKRLEKQLSSKESFCPFCNLIALTLGSNSDESLRLTKIVKEIKFKGVWDELGSRKVSRDNHLQNIWD